MFACINMHYILYEVTRPRCVFQFSKVNICEMFFRVNKFQLCNFLKNKQNQNNLQYKARKCLLTEKRNRKVKPLTSLLAPSDECSLRLKGEISDVFWALVMQFSTYLCIWAVHSEYFITDTFCHSVIERAPQNLSQRRNCSVLFYSGLSFQQWKMTKLN